MARNIKCKACGQNINKEFCPADVILNCQQCKHHVHHNVACWQKLVSTQNNYWATQLLAIEAAEGEPQNHDPSTALYKCKICRSRIVVGCGNYESCNRQTPELSGKNYILCGLCVCNDRKCQETHAKGLVDNRTYSTRCCVSACKRINSGSAYNTFKLQPSLKAIGLTSESGEVHGFANCQQCVSNGMPAVYCDSHGRHHRHNYLWEPLLTPESKFDPDTYNQSPLPSPYDIPHSRPQPTRLKRRRTPESQMDELSLYPPQKSQQHYVAYSDNPIFDDQFFGNGYGHSNDPVNEDHYPPSGFSTWQEYNDWMLSVSHSDFQRELN